MKRFLKNHIALVLALALPILLIIGITAAVYVPRLLTPPPSYAFVYTEGHHGPCTRALEVREEMIVALSVGQGISSDRCQDYDMPPLYIYTPETDEHQSVTLEELERERIDENRRAPDGYRLVQNRGHRGIFELFGRPDEPYWHLQKGSTRHPVALDHLSSYPSPDFLGWIIE